jgi:hypothetical protein
MAQVIQVRSPKPEGIFDTPCGSTVEAQSRKAPVDDWPRPRVDSRAAVAPERIVCQCVELIMLGQGFVFLVAALTMLAG